MLSLIWQPTSARAELIDWTLQGISPHSMVPEVVEQELIVEVNIGSFCVIAVEMVHNKTQYQNHELSNRSS